MFMRNRIQKYKSKIPFTSNYLEECIIEGSKRIGWNEKWHKPGVMAGVKKHGIGMALKGFHFNLKENNWSRSLTSFKKSNRSKRLPAGKRVFPILAALWTVFAPASICSSARRRAAKPRLPNSFSIK
jgi:CO/xanthine dehydrogenase Mo-binding subunit